LALALRPNFLALALVLALGFSGLGLGFEPLAFSLALNALALE